METFTAALTGFLSAAFLGYLVFSFRARGRREAGSLLLVLPRPGTLLGRALFVVATVVLVLGVVSLAVDTILKDQARFFVPNDAYFLPYMLTQSERIASSGPGVAFCAAVLAVILILGSLLWTRNLELRESGIVLSDGLFHFCPWRLVAYCRWLDADTLSIEIPEGIHRVRVAANHIDAVNQILTPRVELRDRDSNVLNANTSREPATPRKKIATADRPLQFSLTTMLLFMIVASSAFAWLGAHLRGREQAALRELRCFTVRNVMDGKSVRAIELADDGGNWSKYEWITDDDMWHVTVCSRLEKLSIQSHRLTDNGIGRLAALRHLTELNLECPLVTDAGVERLATMRNLQSMSLGHCEITDAGLKHLGSMQQLRSLHFSSDRVGNAGLRHLESLSQLETLRFKADRVTSVGLKRLRAALPNTDVQRYR
ncbi:MAG: hypothetical protein GX621_02030 [Pirellulaceae bacterium]|nr:hypothetical protein [Pirellulaceae bacterium]